MKIYELAYIISPELTSEEAEAVAKEIESFVQSNDGIVLRRENPNIKMLAYPVKKQASGFFGALGFQLKPDKVNELEKTIKKEAKIIRHMLVIESPAKKIKIRKGRKELEFKTKIKETSIMQNINSKPEKIELKDIGEKLDKILSE